MRKLTEIKYLESIAAEIIVRALGEVATPCEVVNKFIRMKVRCATTDAANSNLRTEWIFWTVLMHWLCLHVLCHVHKIATAHKRSTAPVDLIITFAMRYSLALHLTGAMNEYRTSIVHVLTRTLKIVRGRCPAERDAFRNVVIKRYKYAKREEGQGWSYGAEYLTPRQLAKLRQCRGLRSVGYAHTFLQKIIGKLSWDVLWALCLHAPTTYNRTKWTGTLEALGDQCLVDLCYGLGKKTAFRHFLWRRQLGRPARCIG